MSGIQGRWAGPSAFLVDPGKTREQHKSVHAGLDIFGPEGTPVYAPFAGKIIGAEDEGKTQYGHVVVLEHKLLGKIFFTLLGHLSAESIARLKVGMRLRRGQKVGEMGS